MAPDGRDRFTREVTLEGPLDETQRRRLLEIAQRCPVHRTLEGGADIFTLPAQPPPLETQDCAAIGHMRAMDAACAD